MKSYPTTNDALLVHLLREGDSAAFTEIYNRYWDKLLSVAANKLNKDIILAEELVQDLFMDLWRRRQDLDISVDLSIYLAAAMKYKVIDARIKRKRVKTFKEDSASHLSIVDTTTEQQLSFHELKDRLGILVQKLPEKCRLIYTLRKEAGYSQKEIAQHLHISEKTVESHLYRAIKALRSGLQNFLFQFF
jgi:RNA polymerase sigma-70 factor (family 1)